MIKKTHVYGFGVKNQHSTIMLTPHCFRKKNKQKVGRLYFNILYQTLCPKTVYNVAYYSFFRSFR